MIKKALIVGWHNSENTGDDAMLQVIIHILNQHFDLTEVDLLVSSRNKHLEDLYGIKINPIYIFDNKFNIQKRINSYLKNKAAEKTDLMIFGGGSIFHSHNSINWKKKMLDIAREKNPNMLALALSVSLGPFKSERAEKLCSVYLSDLNGLIVRDKPSFEIANSCNLNYKPLLMNDFATFLQESDTSIDNDVSIEDGLLGVSINKHPDGEKETDKLLKEVAKSINKLHENRLISKLQLYNFCGDSKHGDQKYNSKLKYYLKDSSLNITVFKYNSSPSSFINSIKRCQVFLGMRLHSQIYSYIAKTNYVPIIYHRKCNDFNKMIGFDESRFITLDKIDNNIIYNKLKLQINDPINLSGHSKINKKELIDINDYISDVISK